MCPCEECLKFPICKYKIAVKCRDMFIYLHTFYKSNCAATHVNVYLNGTRRNGKHINQVEDLFEKPVTLVSPYNYCTIFKEEGDI